MVTNDNINVKTQQYIYYTNTLW